MKIKLGVNTLVWVLPFTDRNMDLVDKVADMGFEVIEITPGMEFKKINPDVLARKLDEKKLEACVCRDFSETQDISSPTASIRQAGVKMMKDLTDWTAAVGLKLIGGPLYAPVGKKRYLPDGERKAEWDRTADALKAIGDYAAKKGVTVAIEPLNRFETDMINTAAHGIAMCEQVRHPSIKLMLDTFHMNIEELDVGEAIRSAGKHLAHFHTCANNRGIPGSDHVPWNEVRKALRAIDYNGYGVIESFAQGQVAAFANIWRPLVSNQDDIPREGLKFLRKALR
jgi:D-psicose/D-tagatose/L-ribulose 3-epimerase